MARRTSSGDRGAAEWRPEPDQRGIERLWLNGLSTSTTRGYAVPESVPAVPANRVVTLAHVPGYRTVRVVGAVTQLSATAGLTATMKGNEALDTAMGALRQTAADGGANAIVGLSASTFGARGGVTSAFGGDAVGVLLMGTAVVVEAAHEPDDPMP